MSEIQEAYKAGVLRPEVHGRLVQNLDTFARRANIPERFVLRKMSDYQCTESDISYVRRLNRLAREGVYGLLYYGPETVPVIMRMMAIAGACLRNFIEAKVVTLQEVVDEDTLRTSVMLIPDFFQSMDQTAKVPDWRIAQIMSLLQQRLLKQKQTVVYVSNMNVLREVYGDALTKHLKTYFHHVKA